MARSASGNGGEEGNLVIGGNGGRVCGETLVHGNADQFRPAKDLGIRAATGVQLADQARHGVHARWQGQCLTGAAKPVPQPCKIENAQHSGFISLSAGHD